MYYKAIFSSQRLHFSRLSSETITRCLYFVIQVAEEVEESLQPPWPENGEEWSEEEAESSMECGLLQVMAEEDEEINIHNDETFGMGVCVCVLFFFTLSMQQ